jgi:cytosine/adenosine deaminase-related metal-dependent hydrolase
MMSDDIHARWLLPNAATAPVAGRRIAIGDGRIDAITAGSGDALVLPPIVNAHDHARVARLSQIGSYDVPLEAWMPFLALIPAVDPWLASAVSFGRSARGGAGAVMAHYTRVQGLTDFPTEARAVARAARDVGIRVALAVQCRDRHPLVYGPSEPVLSRLSPASCACVENRFLRPPLPAAEQVALVEAVAAEIEGDLVTVQYGPAAVQWCSHDMLERIAEGSATHRRRVHMHLLETRYQRDWADQTYPEGIVRFLDRIGLLSPRLSLAHGVYLRPDEMELLAERGVTIVVNTSSNLMINSGIAPVPELLRRGCRVATGLDGAAFDEDEDALREMRLTYNLHKSRGFEITLAREQLLRAAFENGRFAVTGDANTAGITAGGPADLLVLDWPGLSAELVEPDVPPLDLLLARGARNHVRDLIIAGRPVVRGGQTTNIDLPTLEAELLARLRAGFDSTADVRAALPELMAALAGHYHQVQSCC